MYIALYRKYRPKDFSEVVGQDVVRKTLQNAISLNRLSHAYLFSGPRGTGKTTMARILAKCLNCENGPTETPCNKCSLCQRIQEGHCLDIIEIDAASNSGIDNIRDLREKIKFAPTEARHKIYIIDEVHQLSTDAKDAMLKTLEEPPENTFFILATTEPHKLAPTIHSRCQHFEFKRISPQDILSQLKSVAKEEKIQSDEKTLSLISNAADGALRDALSILDQMTALCGKTLVHEDVIKSLGMTDQQSVLHLMQSIARVDAKECLVHIENLEQDGKDIHRVLKSLLEGFRTLLLCNVLGSSHALVALTTDVQKDFETLAARYDTHELFRILNDLSAVDYQMKKEMQPRILLEMAVIRLTQKNGAETQAQVQTQVQAQTQTETVVQTQKSENPEQEAEPVFEKKQEIKKPVPNEDTLKPRQTAETVKKETASKENHFAETEGKESELHFIQKHWKKILSELERQRRPVYSLVYQSIPLKCNQNELTLAFTMDNEFARAQSERHKETVEKIIFEVAHKNYSVRMVAENISEEPQKPKGKVQPILTHTVTHLSAGDLPAQAGAQTDEVQETDIMQDILQTFEGSTVVNES